MMLSKRSPTEPSRAPRRTRGGGLVRFADRQVRRPYFRERVEGGLPPPVNRSIRAGKCRICTSGALAIGAIGQALGGCEVEVGLCGKLRRFGPVFPSLSLLS